MRRLFLILLSASIPLSGGIHAVADNNLYRGNSWANLVSDNKASRIGDALTVIVFQSAEARNSARSDRRRTSRVGLQASTGSSDERLDLDANGAFASTGEVRRSESLLTQFSVEVVGIYPNGDLEVAGEQFVQVNGERSAVGIRGRVRTVDISADNQVISTQIANAEISYDGTGYVSDSAKPGLISRLFLFFGL